MKKSLIALAALAATTAFAQSSVTIWGIADAGLQSASQNGVTKTQLSSSGNASSQLGFKGTEDMGGGMTASFWLESGLTMDAPAAVNFARRQTLDLAGSLGAIRLGRDYTPTFWNHTVFDPFGTLGSGAGSNITGRGQNATTGARTSNGISYLYGVAANGGSHALGSAGVYAQATYAPGEQLSTAAKTGEYSGIRVGYANGPLNVALATAEVTNGALKDKETNIGASYELGYANVSAKYGTNNLKTAVAGAAASGTATGVIPGVAAAEYTWYSIGAKIPLGNGYVPVSYNNSKNNLDSKNANQFAVGYVYNFSKKTVAYGTYSKITNNNGANYGFNGGNGGFGSGLAPTGNGTGYDIGLRTSF